MIEKLLIVLAIYLFGYLVTRTGVHLKRQAFKDAFDCFFEPSINHILQALWPLSLAVYLIANSVVFLLSIAGRVKRITAKDNRRARIQ